jgi:hypothetical protein
MLPQSLFGFFYDCIICFWRSMGVGGLLFAATSLTYILVKNKIQVTIFNLIWIILYLFVFLEYALDYSLYREFLFPSTIAVYSPFILFLIRKYKVQNKK